LIVKGRAEIVPQVQRQDLHFQQHQRRGHVQCGDQLANLLHARHVGRTDDQLIVARHGRHEGVPVLRRMLDRAYVERNVTRQPQARDEVDPVGEVMISGLRAIAALKAEGVSEEVKTLSTGDQSLKVRQAAVEALKNL
jgi:hypothetical protein